MTLEEVFHAWEYREDSEESSFIKVNYHDLPQEMQDYIDKRFTPEIIKDDIRQMTEFPVELFKKADLSEEKIKNMRDLFEEGMQQRIPLKEILNSPNALIQQVAKWAAYSITFELWASDSAPDRIEWKNPVTDEINYMTCVHGTKDLFVQRHSFFYDITFSVAAFADAWKATNPTFIKSHFPAESVFPTDSVTRGFLLPDTLEEKNGFPVPSSKKSTVYITGPSYDDLPEEIHLQSKNIIPGYDDAVHTAIGSIVAEAQAHGETPPIEMTKPMIYRALTGSKNARLDPDDKGMQQLDDSINRLLFGSIWMDTTEEDQAHGFKGKTITQKTIIEGYRKILFPDDPSEYPDLTLVNGKPAREIICVKQMPLYQHANRLNQIARVPISLLNCKIGDRRDTIAIKDYLLRVLKYEKQSEILYSTMIEKLNLSAGEANLDAAAKRMRMKRMRDTVKKIMQHFQEEGEIDSFEDIKKGNSFIGIKIHR